MILKDRFESLYLNFSEDKILVEKFWIEIKKNYSGKSRHYHNLQHLETLFEEIEHVKDKIKNFNSISFSIFYHDVIYDATSKLNEEKSADLAKERLGIVGLNNEDVQQIYEQILATKSHKKSDDENTNFLLDADLSILGKSSQVYLEYTTQIRKEYSIYSDFFINREEKRFYNIFQS
ncbi:HD domain-containing protein [Chryseobacterium balustinum]|uniref:HD domain-containing protein n=1 Tax=Chryseobacterium balustinum TaxID=246 RepID=UPI003CEA61B5